MSADTVGDRLAAIEDDLYDMFISGLEAAFPSRAAELRSLPGKVRELNAELARTRAQRDATQRGLDKANQDNDNLRRQLADLGMGSASLTAVRRYSGLLVDGGEGDYTWVE
jgi:septal ring factor EnvC (AmiA/AmiB activator)